MANLALDDIEARDGPVIIIDPKGSPQGLVNRVIKHIPASLIPHTFYISLRNPAPIEMMDYRDQFEKNLIRGDLVSILQRFVSFGSWGSTMQGTLNNLIPTLLEAEDTSFLDITNFLEDKERREEILAQVSPERRRYWKQHPPKDSDNGPILTRMSNFKEPPLSTIVSGRRGTGISIADIIENDQILLVDTSPLSADGLMLGALVMSRIQQAIFRRDPEREHSMCHVYADEFHYFQTSGFNDMLTQARSFNLSLCLANQHPAQIKDIWDDVKGISTYMLLRMDGEHAHMLRSKIKDPPYVPPERPNKRLLREAIKTMEARAKYWDSQENGGQEAYDASWRVVELENELDQANKPDPPRPPTFLEQIASLPVGRAIFIDHTGKTQRVKMPDPPEPPPYNYMDEIINHTRAASAQSDPIRVGDETPSNSPTTRHDEEDDTIKPSGSPRPKAL
jgi:hypothetical protein